MCSGSSLLLKWTGKSPYFHKNVFIAVETQCNALTERQRKKRKKNHRKLHVRAAISSGVSSTEKQHKGYTWLLVLCRSILSHTFSQSNKVLVYGLFSTCEYHLMIINDIFWRGFDRKGLFAARPVTEDRFLRRNNCVVADLVEQQSGTKKRENWINFQQS